MRITNLEIENVKKIQAVNIALSDGLNVIGGKNKAGKTSILDAICFAVGGAKYKPSEYKNKDTVGKPSIKLELSNGITVTRSGKNGELKVTDSKGKKGGQALLNEFISTLALDLPKFLNSTDKEKAKILLQIIGVEEDLYKLEQEEQEAYNTREAHGRIADQKKKYARELEYWEDVPAEILSASDLINESKTILARNAKRETNIININKFKIQLEIIEEKIKELTARKEELEEKIYIAEEMPVGLEDTSELEQKINDIEIINEKVRNNLDKEHAEEESEKLHEQYVEMTEGIEKIRGKKLELLKSADLPLPDLSITDMVLTYKDVKWDCLSSSEQLKIAVSIVKQLNPKCQFVLMDKLEQMDIETMQEFGEWLDEQELQVIATRVSIGDECSIIIEDGGERKVKTKRTVEKRKPLPKPAKVEILDDDCDF